MYNHPHSMGCQCHDRGCITRHMLSGPAACGKGCCRQFHTTRITAHSMSLSISAFMVTQNIFVRGDASGNETKAFERNRECTLSGQLPILQQEGPSRSTSLRTNPRTNRSLLREFFENLVRFVTRKAAHQRASAVATHSPLLNLPD